jgi:hypothetical protein
MSITLLYASEPDGKRCFNCGEKLRDQRCVANAADGPHWFCKQEPGSVPTESCYQHWLQRQPEGFQGRSSKRHP